MFLQEPKIEFLELEVSNVIVASTECGGNYTCDDVVMADVEICSCFGGPSESVVPFD